MNIYEYQAKKILAGFGVHIPEGTILESVSSARETAAQLGGKAWMVKAQIHAGGRGKAGVVKRAESLEEVEQHVRTLLGTRLITPQTGPKGALVNKVYIEKALNIHREYFSAVVFDRAAESPAIVASADGGMDIEVLSKTSPERILKKIIDPVIGLGEDQLQEIAAYLSTDQQQQKIFLNFIRALYKAYIDKDATLIEINPLALTDDGHLVALDAKMTVDDNALFRQDDITLLRDIKIEDPLELEAEQSGLSYVQLDGNVGCIVNGAGLAMATMDIIRHYGGSPANFLDVGGHATPDSIAKGISIIQRNKNAKALFVNIFGGIVHCDYIARGILSASKANEIPIPIIVRLAGTNANEAMKILSERRLKNIIVAEDFADGAEKAVSAAGT